MSIVVVIAKECLPGRVKTRLHPALSYEAAAELASASLDDTLETVNSLDGGPARRILAFDGETPPDAAAGWEILPQVAGDLDERLAAIFDSCDEPTLLVGMDTPQISAALLAPVFADWAAAARPGPGLRSATMDAWFGPAVDGGFWALGLNKPTGALIRGVAMSRDDTGATQLARLQDAGLRVRLLETLVDVDTIEAATDVAALAPDGRFAATLHELTAAVPPAPAAASVAGPRPTAPARAPKGTR
ncbi:DUF2064 domain-containing protein [Cryobacterium melibiosiphilum]|uniref:DUF2064 domain-containing protein n=1 Tax=Cryobacterium melibiosiphilum TaxID=995039 RepID=A0A3A5MIR8_9MICO|nr:DUF2064 domain-containing protein [Cryobacterium melibiosiphilum]RJT87829.1 DUF2064 domain-containing protein [Cryobacterium melibiosiphilum]